MTVSTCGTWGKKSPPSCILSSLTGRGTLTPCSFCICVCWETASVSLWRVNKKTFGSSLHSWPHASPWIISCFVAIGHFLVIFAQIYIANHLSYPQKCHRRCVGRQIRCMTKLSSTRLRKDSSIYSAVPPHWPINSQASLVWHRARPL